MIEAEREPFAAGCEKNAVDRQTSQEIFEDILRFGGYAFNKAHSTGYALVAFKTAYLKTYYPTEYMAGRCSPSRWTRKTGGRVHRRMQSHGLQGQPAGHQRVPGNDFTVVKARGAGVSPP
jgi:DNA polymerase III alpha subunit